MKFFAVIFLACIAIVAAQKFDCSTPVNNFIKNPCINGKPNPNFNIASFQQLQQALNGTISTTKPKCEDVKSACESALKAIAPCIPSGDFAQFEESICKALGGT